MLVIATMMSACRFRCTVHRMRIFSGAGDRSGLGHGMNAGLGEGHGKKRNGEHRAKRHPKKVSDPSDSSHASFGQLFAGRVKRIYLQVRFLQHSVIWLRQGWRSKPHHSIAKLKPRFGDSDTQLHIKKTVAWLYSQFETQGGANAVSEYPPMEGLVALDHSPHSATVLGGNALVAQLAEQRFCKPPVAGSIPAEGPKAYWAARSLGTFRSCHCSVTRLQTQSRSASLVNDPADRGCGSHPDNYYY